jgi:hypothetical protein
MSSALEDRAVEERNPRKHTRSHEQPVNRQPSPPLQKRKSSKEKQAHSAKPGRLAPRGLPETRETRHHTQKSARVSTPPKENTIPWDSDGKHLDATVIEADSDEEDFRPIVEATKRETVADKRNRDRVEKANVSDQKLASKYLPCSVDAFLPNTIPGPDDTFIPPPWLMKAVSEVATTEVPIPAAPPVKFDLSASSVEHNTRLLQDSGLSLQKLLLQHQDTTLGFGSEFRPLAQLRKVLGQHPNFGFFSDVLENGMNYHFTDELSEEQRRAEVTAMIDRGNHKSVQEDSEEVGKLLEKDVLHGFSLPVSPAIVSELEGAMVQPAGVVKQFSLQEDGSRHLKRRLTQDLSFPLTSPDASVNKRIDMTAYTEMIYGWCLSRIIHFIVALRLAYPLLRIFIVKYDYSDAYRRVAHSPAAAAQSIIIFSGVAYIALRLTFGGSANPPTWCSFSEMVTDLSNELSLCTEWNHNTLRSPAQPDTPEPSLLPDNIPIALAMPLAVTIPTTVTAKTDSFIDDLIRIFLDTPQNRAREPHTVPLAIHVTSRPHMGQSEPVRRRGLLSAPKLEAEGTPEEEQIVLGWRLNTRTLTIILPSDKFEAWSSDIRKLVAERKGTYGELESTLGRLNHVAFIIPLSRHFLTKLRFRLNRRRHKKQQISLQTEEVADLDLWQRFLSKANNGISMNQVTIRRPSKLAWSDSCPFGIGGFLLSGRAWRVRIPESSPIYGVDIQNNVLEFLGMVITVWLAIFDCAERGSHQDCILAIGDNTSAIGWLYKSSRLKPGSLYYKPVQLIARQLARLIIDSSHCLASQHIKGDQNTVSDLLSFAGTARGYPHPLAHDFPSDSLLTQRFHAHIPQLIPKDFDISPLPSEISSFLIQALQTIELSWILNKRKLTKNETESGAAGSSSAPKWASSITLSSLNYSTKRTSLSSVPFCPSTEWLSGVQQEPFLASVRAPWFHRLCAMPQAIWLRRFGVTSNQVPFTSKEAPSYSPPSAPF